MNTFTKRCGHFEIEISPPYPRWVRLFHNRHGDRLRQEELGGCTSDELHDLKYIIDRAISFVEKADGLDGRI